MKYSISPVLDSKEKPMLSYDFPFDQSASQYVITSSTFCSLRNSDSILLIPPTTLKPKADVYLTHSYEFTYLPLLSIFLDDEKEETASRELSETSLSP